jgi:hypothetical protein
MKQRWASKHRFKQHNHYQQQQQQRDQQRLPVCIAEAGVRQQLTAVVAGQAAATALQHTGRVCTDVGIQ